MAFATAAIFAVAGNISGTVFFVGLGLWIEKISNEYEDEEDEPDDGERKDTPEPKLKVVND